MYVKIVRHTKKIWREAIYECKSIAVQKAKDDWKFELTIEPLCKEPDTSCIVDKRDHSVFLMNEEGSTIETYRWGFEKDWPNLDENEEL